MLVASVFVLVFGITKFVARAARIDKAALGSTDHRHMLGSTGCQPVLFGSLPKSSSICIPTACSAEDVVGKLPTTAGWQPALPNPQN